MKFSNYCTLRFWTFTLSIGSFFPTSYAITQSDCSYIVEKNKLEDGLPDQKCWYGTMKNDVLEVSQGRVLLNKADIGEYSSNVKHRFYGFGGNDEIYGGEYSDYLDGGSGKDVEYGFEGDDILNGGKNLDTLRGDKGKDSFIDPSDQNLLIVDSDDEYPVKFSYEYFDEMSFQKYLACYHDMVKSYTDEIPEKIADQAMKFCSTKIFHGIDTAFGQFMVCRSKAATTYVNNNENEVDQKLYSEMDLKNCIQEMLSPF